MFIVKNRTYFYVISAVLVALSLVAFATWGLNPGIDFKGGSIIEVEYATSTRPTSEAVTKDIEALNIGEFSIRETGEAGFILRTKELDPSEHERLLGAFAKSSADAVEKRFDSVGPVLGKEALEKSWISVALVLLAIVFFITFAFRKVSKPISSWTYGLMAIVGLIHDIIIPVGVFAYLGRFQGVEIDTLFVTALLVILGYSVHDKIVVFDRVRENLKVNNEEKQKKSFETIVGESIGQTFVRSVNTSLTTLIAVLVLYLVGPEATKYFSLALLVGIVAGTYSSIFIGSPLLITVHNWKQRRSS